MKFLGSLVTLSALAATTTALQSIYVGTRSADYVKGGRYVVWFSDSDVCKQGVTYGYPGYGVDVCDYDFTLLGHPDIEFTGCYPAPHGDNPTGVKDGDAAALTCSADGADGPLGPDLSTVKIQCPGDSQSANGYEVELRRYCK
ncbi:hypothetical protein P152DRAFT_165663 [Eremomyces bilateralis CBS 781.70]|uniref:Uncharacterized protein n=1 Tax=Eremomyces bilateralis CBS 781.70 TaxID=1392243 RepID=A0A6G1FUQ1_9PEZI|nr:uncharacterized protein P152DRAFT_165663 [Eremomyces bilateralis CBS 781.70]KAF1809436.1 hypothetical protein P152DRAFT_165663 [Eremomyces bilateralis CBS 781.70]